MTINFLDELLALIKSTGVSPEQYMLEHSLFFDVDVVDRAFGELLDKREHCEPIYVRKTTKKDVTYQSGKDTFWKSVYEDIPDILVLIDGDGNREVRNIIKKFTGEIVSQGANSSIKFGKISHIWGETSNPLFFTSLWNIVVVPAYFNDVLDKSDGSHAFITKIKNLYESICWTEYDVADKLNVLGLTEEEINQYAPDVSVLDGLFFKKRIIHRKEGVEISSPKDRQQYAVNGHGPYAKGKVAREAVKFYVKQEQNKKKSGVDIVNDWMSLNVKVPNFIETKSEFDNRIELSTDRNASKRSEEIELPGGDVVYVSNQYTPQRIHDLMKKVNARHWGITISEYP